MAIGFKPDAESPPLEDSPPYAALVCTRPDIAAAVTSLCRVMQSTPTQQHWSAAKRVLRYLSGTKQQGLTYLQDSVNCDELLAWSNTSYANVADNRLTGGSLITLDRAAVCKQTYVFPTLKLPSQLLRLSMMSWGSQHKTACT